MAALHASYAPLVAALLVIAAVPARADGAMVVGDRELFREGPVERGYCKRDGSGSPEECERVVSKVLSGFSYGRGHATGGLALDPTADHAPSGLAALQVHAASAALPGGTIVLGAIDGVLGDARTSRVRVTLVDSEGLFFCRDAQTGELALPFVAMLSRACEPNAMLAVDLGLFAIQWDLAQPRVMSEWLRLGPSIELLGNGHGYSQLSRSIQIGVPFDLRSVHHGGSDVAHTSLGAGIRISARYRLHAWEARLSARHRMELLGRAGRAGHAIESELLALHNFFLSDAVIVQVGLAARASWSEQPASAFTAWSSTERNSDAFAGIHLGWSHEPPDI
jgi:hypothetical protein